WAARAAPRRAARTRHGARDRDARHGPRARRRRPRARRARGGAVRGLSWALVLAALALPAAAQAPGAAPAARSAAAPAAAWTWCEIDGASALTLAVLWPHGLADD